MGENIFSTKNKEESKIKSGCLVDPASGYIPHALGEAIEKVYKPAGMNVTAMALREAESSEYGACRFGLDGRTVVFRIAKTTPTKIGQFVTIWKRPTPSDEIAPLDMSDDVDFVVVSVADKMHQGQFVFDQKLLITNGIMSCNGEGGKRAIRVYPPWTMPVAKDAIKSQKWQLKNFLYITQEGTADLEQVRKLFKM